MENTQVSAQVLELLDEIEDVIDTASGFPLTGKVMVDADEILEIVKEIRVQLPDEIQQAQWIRQERQRILDEAKKEYEDTLLRAQAEAEALIENDDIVKRAKSRAQEIISIAETNCKQLKMSTFEYVDRILYNFQGKMEELSTVYFADIVSKMEKGFEDIDLTLTENRNQIKELAYKAQTEE